MMTPERRTTVEKDCGTNGGRWISPAGIQTTLGGGNLTIQKAQELEQALNQSAPLYDDVGEAIENSFQFIEQHNKEANEIEQIFIYAQQILDTYEDYEDERKQYYDLYQNIYDDFSKQMLLDSIDTASQYVKTLKKKLEIHKIMQQQDASPELAELEYSNGKHIKTLTFMLEQQLGDIIQFIQEYIENK